jgi:hypothetical protein
MAEFTTSTSFVDNFEEMKNIADDVPKAGISHNFERSPNRIVLSIGGCDDDDDDEDEDDDDDEDDICGNRVE